MSTTGAKTFFKEVTLMRMAERSGYDDVAAHFRDLVDDYIDRGVRYLAEHPEADYDNLLDEMLEFDAKRINNNTNQKL